MLHLALASVLSLLTATPPPSPGCAYDSPALQAMSPDAFDQDLKGGWRALSNRKCYLEAAIVIRDYREANLSKLRSFQISILYWHEGQARALAGQSEAAVPLLMAGVYPYNPQDFADYALGSVAFLQHDLQALKAARERLASLAKPADWQAESTLHVTVGGVKMSGVLPWPPNLNVLDGLIACFGKPYAEAYTPPCTKSFAMKPEGL